MSKKSKSAFAAGSVALLLLSGCTDPGTGEFDLGRTVMMVGGIALGALAVDAMKDSHSSYTAPSYPGSTYTSSSRSSYSDGTFYQHDYTSTYK